MPGPSTLVRLLAVAAAAAGLLFAATSAFGDAVGDQQQISSTGDADDVFRDALDASNAFNPQTQQWLVVWSADDEQDGAFQIMGRFVDAAGNPVGSQFAVSDPPVIGTESDFCTGSGACVPDVAYNATANEFLVVWEVQRRFLNFDREPAGVPTSGGEIYAQRLSATGEQLGTNGETGSEDALISDAETGLFNIEPAVAANPRDNQYLVTWTRDEEVGPKGGFQGSEIAGQRLDATGTEIGDNDFLISDPTINESADDSDVAHNGVDNEYLVTWDDDISGAGEGHDEIMIQRLDSGGGRVGPINQQISDTGENDADADIDGQEPRVAHQPITNEYVVSFDGEVQVGDPQDPGGQDEIAIQRLSAAGAEIGPNDQRISSSPPGDEEGSSSQDSGVAADTRSGEFLVVWHKVTGQNSVSRADAGEGEEDDRQPAGEEPSDLEIHGQYLTAGGAETGSDDFQISSHDPAGDPRFAGATPVVAYDAVNCQYLAAWNGVTRAEEFSKGPFGGFGSSEQKVEAFGRRASAPACPVAVAAPPPPAPATPARPARPRVRVAGVRRRCVRTSVRIRLRVTAATGATLRSVRVTLDGRRIRTTTRSRSTIRINVRRLRAGRHRLRIVATDSVGNRTTVNRTITKCARRAQRRAPRFTG